MILVDEPKRRYSCMITWYMLEHEPHYEAGVFGKPVVWKQEAEGSS